jgi:hypothetical protein
MLPAWRGPGTSKRIVRQVDARSVVRIAFGLSLSFSAVVLVGLVALYLLALASGAKGSVDSFMSGVGLSFNPVTLFPVVLIILAAGTLLFTGLAAVTALLYNAVADVIGGVELLTRERAAGEPEADSVP